MALVDAAVERFGGVDILVNKAAATTGDISGEPFPELTRAEGICQNAGGGDQPSLARTRPPSAARTMGGLPQRGFALYEARQPLLP